MTLEVKMWEPDIEIQDFLRYYFVHSMLLRLFMVLEGSLNGVNNSTQVYL